MSVDRDRCGATGVYIVTVVECVDECPPVIWHNCYRFCDMAG